MSSPSGNPILKVDEASDNEHNTCKKLPRLARSPHPYAFLRSEVLNGTQKTPDYCEPQSVRAHTPHNDTRSVRDRASKPFSDTDSRKRRKDSTTPSDSGTEADDEGGPLLKSLPAPPPRLRKGLKDEANSGTTSPLLTPSYLDDEKRRKILEAQFKRGLQLQSHVSSDKETLKIRDKFVKKRRAELIRRTTETILFLSVGCLASRKLLLQSIPRGSFDQQLPDD